MEQRDATVNKITNANFSKQIDIPSFSVDTNIGTLDTESVRMKLNELSPYYLSPGTLKYITSYLTQKTDIAGTVGKTTQIMQDTQQVTATIRVSHEMWVVYPDNNLYSTSSRHGTVCHFANSR